MIAGFSVKEKPPKLIYFTSKSPDVLIVESPAKSIPVSLLTAFVKSNSLSVPISRLTGERVFVLVCMQVVP